MNKLKYSVFSLRLYVSYCSRAFRWGFWCRKQNTCRGGPSVWAGNRLHPAVSCTTFQITLHPFSLQKCLLEITYHNFPGGAWMEFIEETLCVWERVSVCVLYSIDDWAFYERLKKNIAVIKSFEKNCICSRSNSIMLNYRQYSREEGQLLLNLCLVKTPLTFISFKLGID